MPSVAQEEPILSSSKKRRRDDHDADIHLQLYGPGAPDLPKHTADPPSSTPQDIFASQGLFYPTRNDSFHRLHADPTNGAAAASAFFVNRKIISIPKRIRLEDTRRGGDFVEAATLATDARGRPRSTSLSPRKVAQSATTTNEATALQQTNANSRPAAPARTISGLTLSPCHICHRRPTKKSDLDSFADCEGCGKRSCFVCIRECQGWQCDDTLGAGLQFEIPTTTQVYDVSFSMDDTEIENQVTAEHREPKPRPKDSWAGRGSGHRQMVCSRCCVERGADGDIVCLGCLPFVEG
jgi:hypothetical protein